MASGARSRKRRVKIPYLGRISLHWCDTCNVPLLDKHPCQICGQSGHTVPISPPGDVRPAFFKDIQLLRSAVNAKFGAPIGELMFPVSKIVLLNRIGGLDRTDEVVMDGKVMGIFQYDPVKARFRFQPRVDAGKYILFIQEHLQLPPTKQIRINSDGAPYILQGKSALAPGVESLTSDIHANEYVLLVHHDSDIFDISNRSKCIGIGIARGNSQELQEMLRTHHGALAKNKTHLSSTEAYRTFSSFISPHLSQLRDVESLNEDQFQERAFKVLHKAYDANLSYIQHKILKATQFIEKTIASEKKPIAVAYSGGKDSLGVLLLVWKVLGPHFKIFFANTGLELPEVEANIQQVAAVLGMQDKLIIKHAGNTFWEIVESFGPPGRDYRYCCHSLKAQQITDLITSLYDGQKVLSFLGQRQYESLSRAQSKMVYVNSFIPLQIAATPIKSWNALLLWLFILFEPVYDFDSSGGMDPSTRLNVPITPLYNQGHERLGCYLCPAANLSSFELIKTSHPKLYNRWFDYLDRYAEKFGLPPEWIDLGLWRFKHYSPQWKNLIKEQNIPITFTASDPSAPLEFILTKGFSPCENSGFSVKGRFSLPLDLPRLMDYLPALTKDYSFDEELNVLSVNSIFKKQKYRFNIFADGSIFLHSMSNSFPYGDFLKLLVGTVFRAQFCNQCKTCISICPTHAISLSSTGIQIDRQKCSQCFISNSHQRQCITHCPLFQLSKKISDIFDMDS